MEYDFVVNYYDFTMALEGVAAGSGISISALPIKYVSLPLTTKVMTRSDYEPLTTKIRNRLLSWTSKAVSYAGRLLLIKSVIASITNFWCAAFCLPQSCIDDIESMCSAFLWSGSPNITSRDSTHQGGEQYCILSEAYLAPFFQTKVIVGHLGQKVLTARRDLLGCKGLRARVLGMA